MSDDLIKRVYAVMEKHIPYNHVEAGDVRDAAIDVVAIFNAELAAEREKAFTAMRVFERYRELEAQIDKLREALEPFAELGADANQHLFADTDWLAVHISNLRHARAVLEDTGDTQ